ncbi:MULTISPECIES: acetate--CoA ligase family protein [Sphingomonas]|jgi:acyl-CoA synthetase (NDP forming)|uniref:CoA-binding protein n=1 Tax=Sphingomonas hankookensis TaxID=563996 RepID=A0ABR5YBU1_9SPHN|nr:MULTISPECIES: acetate--CoA ligase family protein [Sphingomonas]KZE14632.1 CoA-binding protein [Sphingomonas hankookensis]PZT92163.1 MAG: CoA-binding protein [Sphingomonas sp.]RSV20256.1 CoA-binding protein [Sphingomonas sp. ABOLH]WCP72613.1 acetate--CoA ligase family protein [Sphingomonas hankookensis]
MPDLSRLLTPRSVVIVGASPTPGALGNSVLRNLERHGYAGDIHLINPKRDTIDGRPCLQSIDDLPDGVDTAVLAIPGPAVLGAVQALARRNVGAAIIFSAGFAEGGEEGLAAQAEVARIAAEYGMVVEGPNCLGLVNYAAGVPLTFVEAPVLDLTHKPSVGIVSQSGAMAVVLGATLMAKDLGITASVSTGNEAASGVEDYVEHLLGDPQTLAIAMIVEQFRQPAHFLKLADRARAAGKPIVLLHPGTSSAARESAATHTGAMAGDWQLMKAKVERAGVVLVDSLEALGDVIDIAVRAKPVRRGGTAVLTESGAFKALTLDLAEAIGLDLPAMAGETAAAMRAAVPDFIPVSNPMDLTAQALVDPDLYRRTLIPLLADDAYAALVFGIIQTDAATSARKFPPIIDAVRALAPDKPVIFAGLDDGAPVPGEYIAGLRAIGVPYFPSPDRAFRALGHLLRHAARDFTAAEAAPVTLDLPGGVIPEYRAKELLAPVGIPFPAGGFAADVAEAQAIASRVGYPVAIKAQAAALSHKSDAGGVILNIADDDALAEAWERLFANVAAYDASIALDGAQVEAMGKRGVELIVGARNDPEWGPVILAGFGGVTAELLHDVRLLAVDLTPDAIVAELRALKQGALFDGYRGSPALDVEAVAVLIAGLGRVLAGSPTIREIDLNPVVVYPKGEGVVALDALILADAE